MNHKTLVLFIKSVVFTLVVPGTVAIALPLWIAAGVREVNLGSSGLGLFCFVSGIGIYSGCVWDFIYFGKGTPSPIDAPQQLVVRGLYHYSRNPMYVAVLLVILGWVFVYTSGVLLLYGVAVWGCFQMLVIFYEEPMLQQLFGDSYVSYKKLVKRWVATL